MTEAVRRTLDRLRADILVGTVTELPSTEALCAQISASCRASRLPSLRGVINATGIVLHTNLGRACLSDRALAAARGVSQGYSTLEYDLTAGERGQRYAHVEPLLCRLTGAEAAMVANNNAAAVLLILSALTAGGEVITSRGELVEIGGSFRMPDVMAACGAVLREVGSTNKTHLSDYANAISEQTRALLKVHTSNYRIVGFTESVSPAALAELGRSRSIPVIEDLGSGCLVDLAPLGLRDEPTVQASVKAGVDVLSFSGDKLLGGPQAGIIVGKRRCIDLLKRHPLARALRVDKLTLAALEATLQAYVDGTALQEIPVLSMLAQTPEELRQRAESLCRRMGESGVTAEVVSTENPVGGGAVPTQTLHSFAVAVVPRDSAAARSYGSGQSPSSSALPMTGVCWICGLCSRRILTRSFRLFGRPLHETRHHRHGGPCRSRQNRSGQGAHRHRYGPPGGGKAPGHYHRAGVCQTGLAGRHASRDRGCAGPRKIHQKYAGRGGGH